MSLIHDLIESDGIAMYDDDGYIVAWDGKETIAGSVPNFEMVRLMREAGIMEAK